jgi:hypothetical protein
MLTREHHRRRLAATNLVFQLTQGPRQLCGLVTEWVNCHDELLRNSEDREAASPRWLVFYGCSAGRGDRLEASERVTWVAVTRELVGLL